MAKKAKKTEPSSLETSKLGGSAINMETQADGLNVAPEALEISNQLGQITGRHIRPDLALLAVTHRSWVHEHGGEHNERLEFLGDSVLSFAIAQYLYREFPDIDPEQMTKYRQVLVSGQSLAEIARAKNIGHLIRLGNGEKKSGGEHRDKVLEDTLEAIIGAVYLSNGIDIAVGFVMDLMIDRISRMDSLLVTIDPKTVLQETAQRHGVPLPVYEVEQHGPDHRNVFTALVTMLGASASGEGGSKKNAEMDAAIKLVTKLQKAGKIKI